MAEPDTSLGAGRMIWLWVALAAAVVIYIAIL